MEPIVPPSIDAYCAAHSSAPSALLDELYNYTIRNCPDAQMLVGPLEAAFLQMLLRVSGTRRVLEIGTFTGYSALAMAEALPDDGELTTCDIDLKTSAVAQSFFDRSPHGRKINLRVGAATKTIQSLPHEPTIDFVFIDADKENYTNYYEAVLPRLKPNGLIVADNVLWSGRVLNPQQATDRAIVQFNDHVYSDVRVEKVMVPIRDGVLLVRKL